MLHRATRKRRLLASVVVGWLASLGEISILLKELRPLLMLVLPASLKSFLVSGLSPTTVFSTGFRMLPVYQGSALC